MVKAIHDLVQHHAKISPTKLGHMELRLLADEAGGLLHEPSITTVTFYRGAVSQLALRMALRTQLFKVVSKNPWLAGRVIEKEKVDKCSSSQSAGHLQRRSRERRRGHEAGVVREGKGNALAEQRPSNV